MKISNVTNNSFCGYSGLNSFRIPDRTDPAALSSLTLRLDNNEVCDFDMFSKSFPQIKDSEGLLTVINISGVSPKDYSPVNILKFNDEIILFEEMGHVDMPYKNGKAMSAVEYISKLLQRVYKDTAQVDVPLKIVSDYRSAGASISALCFGHSDRVNDLAKLFIDDYYANGVEVDKSVIKHTIKHIDKLVRKYLM